MLLGAMIMGPLVGWLMKKVDQFLQPRTPQGFEMLFNNFSAGILAFIMTILGFKLLAPIMQFIMHILSVAVEFLVHLHLLPIVSIIVEPAKILFLNNAINHGVFTPLGTDQAASAGQSILFAIESNPGPGIGILLAYMIFGKGTAKATSYGAGIIHFFGGIHEIYFPYVLMRPLLFIAVILGGMTGVATYQATGFGFKSPASPGSFIVYCLNAPKGEFLHMVLGVFLAALISFVVATLIMKLTYVILKFELYSLSNSKLLNFIMWLFIFSWLLLNLLMFNIFNSSILLSNNTFSLINLFSSFNIHINVLTFSF